MGIFGGIFGGGGSDTDAPEVTIVSPTPGVAPGEPGGFPLDYRLAKATPIVIDVVDTAPGNRLINVVFQQAASSTTDAIEEVIYRRGSFRGGYIAGSAQQTITDGVRLTCVRAAGWPGSDAPAWTITVDAIDENGNLT